jgi:hypothetical protein
LSVMRGRYNLVFCAKGQESLARGLPWVIGFIA